MLKGYIRPVTGYSEATQRKLLNAAGVKDRDIYVESKKPREDLPDRQKLLDSLRAGDVVVVPWLWVLARSRTELLAVTKEIATHDATIREADADVQFTDLRQICVVIAAVTAWTGDLKLASKAKREARARAGGLAKAKEYKRGKMTRAKAEKIWMDKKTYRTNAEAAGATGWTAKTLHNWFGASGRQAGNPETRKS